MAGEKGQSDKTRGEELEGTVTPLVATVGLGALTIPAAAAQDAKPTGPLPTVGVVLPAGGQGLRAGGAEPKQFLSLRPGRAMLAYALETFHGMDCVKEIVLVLPPERLQAFAFLASQHPKLKLVAGGAERWESVRNGVEALDASLPFVAIHDVARPFVGEAVIRRCLEAVTPDACVLAALPATDTVKEAEGADVIRTLDRRRLVLAQTPQVFPRAALAAMHAADWKDDAPTDEASMAEKLGWTVRWVRGSDVNRKVTSAADLQWAAWLAQRLEAGETLPDA